MSSETNTKEDKLNIQEGGKKKTSCLVPVSLLTALNEKGYYNQSDAIIKGLECLLREGTLNLKEEVNNLREENKNLMEENENIKRRLQYIQDHNETLKIELERANVRELNNKEMFNNHVLQVQTLINQRSIAEEKENIKKSWWKIW